eukprot:CAMPEP_0169132048 /NCGR_PEP_ID=MMETSP1015-20121227/38581_1 /TAXON_ID=342587 /ORGANISM="Karlodinium micrum, Strain CCMP2283" /LENGTH=166 /DNA_ID=CAMNT_0009196367 /DNA_START=213 /DNA_END=713 /DNA_ORIENTATION=+
MRSLHLPFVPKRNSWKPAFARDTIEPRLRVVVQTEDELAVLVVRTEAHFWDVHAFVHDLANAIDVIGTKLVICARKELTVPIVHPEAHFWRVYAFAYAVIRLVIMLVIRTALATLTHAHILGVANVIGNPVPVACKGEKLTILVVRPQAHFWGVRVFAYPIIEPEA